MRRPTARGCAGALVAIAVAAAAVSVPGTMSEPPAEPQVETFISAACGGVPPCPSADRLARLGELQTVLAERMPDLPESDRTRLAGVIYEEARAASLDPLFVLAVIAVESGFDNVKRSGAGARGLMQLLPSTLRREASRSKLDGAPDDPVLNVRAGVRYLGRLLRAFGSTDVALMAYNAGPNRILRYLEEEEGIPDRFQVYARRIHREHGLLKRKRPAPLAATRGPRTAVGPRAASVDAR
jgi:hypothetical protein